MTSNASTAGVWNYADVWETIADAVPTSTAQIHGTRRLSWKAFDERADGIAQALLDGGAVHQDKVAIYLTNAPEYLETTFAAMKIGLVPVNTNYRYQHDELFYLWDNSEAVAVVFHGSFADRIEGLRERLPRVRQWIWVDDGSGPCPSWALAYEAAAKSATDRHVQAPWGRSGDDIVMIYTGGTTGMPKGVMWRQHDLYRAFNSQGDPDVADLEVVTRRLGTFPPPKGIPCSPMMHATGFMFALTMLNQGGCVVSLSSRNFDAEGILDLAATEQVTTMAIVGDAFARPLLTALDAHPGRWDFSHLGMVVSAGVMWSAEVKAGIAAHFKNTLLVDMLGSTEAHGMGTSVVSADNPTTGIFQLGHDALIVSPDGRVIEPGSGEAGLVAVRGLVPLGYYKDPDKTAATFMEVNGERCIVPGDWATVDADGTVHFLGRGSVCINTAGEKVFPEEVEEALKEHAAVDDATAVGVPDERFGELVCAVVTLVPGSQGVPEAELIAHVKERLAGYKAPKHVLVVDSLGRGPNGKADYAGVRTRMIEALSSKQT